MRHEKTLLFIFVLTLFLTAGCSYSRSREVNREIIEDFVSNCRGFVNDVNTGSNVSRAHYIDSVDGYFCIVAVEGVFVDLANPVEADIPIDAIDYLLTRFVKAKRHYPYYNRIVKSIKSNLTKYKMISLYWLLPKDDPPLEIGFWVDKDTNELLMDALLLYNNEHRNTLFGIDLGKYNIKLK